MRIAILGATSQIGKDLVRSFAAKNKYELDLYARRNQAVSEWLGSISLADRFAVHDFSSFSTASNFDAILNFVGVGNPAQASAMGASIFDVTLHHDELALNYVRQHPSCRYIFLSSGAAYGTSFDVPVDAHSRATIAINNLKPQEWYAVAKLHAECRHRALAPLSIVDIRVFNYFSHTQDMGDRFLITDIVRAIRDKKVLKTSADYMVRDYIGPDDFYQLVNAILVSPAANVAVDCYSRAPIEKATLLAAMQEKFGLQYELVQSDSGVNATGAKPHYYSVNKRAENFGYVPRNTSLENLFFQMANLNPKLDNLAVSLSGPDFKKSRG
jgi:nucleoside-diphosphate-sugar epimerase